MPPLQHSLQKYCVGTTFYIEVNFIDITFICVWPNYFICKQKLAIRNNLWLDFGGAYLKCQHSIGRDRDLCELEVSLQTIQRNPVSKYQTKVKNLNM